MNICLTTTEQCAIWLTSSASKSPGEVTSETYSVLMSPAANSGFYPPKQPGSSFKGNITSFWKYSHHSPLMESLKCTNILVNKRQSDPMSEDCVVSVMRKYTRSCWFFFPCFYWALAAPAMYKDTMHAGKYQTNIAAQGVHRITKSDKTNVRSNCPHYAQLVFLNATQQRLQ